MAPTVNIRTIASYFGNTRGYQSASINGLWPWSVA